MQQPGSRGEESFWLKRCVLHGLHTALCQHVYPYGAGNIRKRMTAKHRRHQKPIPTCPEWSGQVTVVGELARVMLGVAETCSNCVYVFEAGCVRAEAVRGQRCPAAFTRGLRQPGRAWGRRLSWTRKLLCKGWPKIEIESILRSLIARLSSAWMIITWLMFLESNSS